MNRLDQLSDWIVHECDATGQPVLRADASDWIMETFGVAKQTAGRDLVKLLDRGSFVRVWGGRYMWPRLAPPPPGRSKRIRVGSVHVMAEIT